MDWKQILVTLDLADLKATMHAESGNLVRFDAGGNRYGMYHDKPEGVTTALDIEITPQIDRAVKDQVLKQLNYMAPTLGVLPDESKTAIVACVAVRACLDYVATL